MVKNRQAPECNQHDCSGASSGRSFDSSVQTLREMYPDSDPELLIDLLCQFDNSVTAVVDFLNGEGASPAFSGNEGAHTKGMKNRRVGGRALFSNVAGGVSKPGLQRNPSPQTFKPCPWAGSGNQHQSQNLHQSFPKYCLQGAMFRSFLVPIQCQTSDSCSMNAFGAPYEPASKAKLAVQRVENWICMKFGRVDGSILKDVVQASGAHDVISGKMSEEELKKACFVMMDTMYSDDNEVSGYIGPTAAGSSGNAMSVASWQLKPQGVLQGGGNVAESQSLKAARMPAAVDREDLESWDSLWEEADNLNSESLREDAHSLARMRNQLFELARVYYANGHGAKAKQLSIQGHEVQKRFEAAQMASGPATLKRNNICSERLPATLDLHGLVQSQAYRLLSAWIREWKSRVRDGREGRRQCTVIAGAGHHSQGSPVLRKLVPQVQYITISHNRIHNHPLLATFHHKFMNCMQNSAKETWFSFKNF